MNTSEAMARGYYSKPLSQSDKLYRLLQKGPARTDTIQQEVYGGDHRGLARVAARIYDIKKKYGVTIKGFTDPHNPQLYWYKITNE